MVNLFIGEDTTNRMDRWINGWMDGQTINKQIDRIR